VVSGGFGLLTLHEASLSLEDVFLQLTTSEPAADVPAGVEVTA